MKKRLPALLAICIIMALTLAGCSGNVLPSSSKKEAVNTTFVNVGVRDNLVNLSFKDAKSGRYYGLEIDIASEIATRCGYGSARFTTVTPDDREEKLQSGAVDMLVASYTITPERQETVDFSPAYFVDHTEVMVEDTTGFAYLSDLKGANIGVMTGTNSALELARELVGLGVIPEFDDAAFEAETFNGGITFTVLNSYHELDLALEYGDIDAFCSDGAIAMGYKRGSRLYLEESFGEENYGVATRKGDALSAKVAAAVQAMIDDGTLDTLIDKWN